MDDLFWFEGELGRTPIQDKYCGSSLGAVTAHLNSRVIAEDKRPSTQFSNEGKKRVPERPQVARGFPGSRRPPVGFVTNRAPDVPETHHRDNDPNSVQSPLFHYTP